MTLQRLLNLQTNDPLTDTSETAEHTDELPTDNDSSETAEPTDERSTDNDTSETAEPTDE